MKTYPIINKRIITTFLALELSDIGAKLRTAGPEQLLLLLLLLLLLQPLLLLGRNELLAAGQRRKQALRVAHPNRSTEPFVSTVSISTGFLRHLLLPLFSGSPQDHPPGPPEEGRNGAGASLAITGDHTQ